MKKIADGFLKKDTKAFNPDPKTGKWKGRKTPNGQFATIKPGWSCEIKIGEDNYRLDVWAFNTRWGSSSLFYKLFKETENKEPF